ncbi:hypothetical protein [Tsuneonella amylolytica]|uniref:hypothetical protein n=1 Tax=Tsuneonella amylolytica TaxID=2338327 RepID=UPI00389A0676
MSDNLIYSATSLTAIAIVAFAMLRGWQGWLTLKERELDRSDDLRRIAPHSRDDGPDTGSALGAARIEISDLKERIRKLEAIASGVDL